MPKPLIAVTMGDPAGVGPEICLQLLANEEVCQLATPVIFGDARLLARCARQMGLQAPPRIVSEIEWSEKCREIDGPAVLDLFGFDIIDDQLGIDYRVSQDWPTASVFAFAARCSDFVASPLSNQLSFELGERQQDV